MLYEDLKSKINQLNNSSKANEFFDRLNKYYPLIIEELQPENIFIISEDNIGFVWNNNNYYVDLRFGNEINLEAKTPNGIITKQHTVPNKMINPLLYSMQLINNQEINPMEYNHG
jgi:hypothetical protein